MATDINSIKDASGNSINDYKAAYAKAAAEGDEVGMKAANEAANAIRKQEGVYDSAKHDATADIAKVQSGGQSGMVTEPDRWDRGTTAPSGYTGSANSVTTYTPEQQSIIDQMNANSIQWHTALHGDANTPGTKEWYEQQNKNLSASLGGGVTFDPVTGYWSGTADKPAQQLQVNMGSANTASKTDTAYLQDLLNQWRDAATTQSQNSVDYAVQKAVADLERALEDSKAQFKEQQETVSRDEMQGRDNAALYAELRGDKGGIGQEQYSSIMNTAAQNRLAVQQAQTKLSTDTQRQIADLRAQGEFEKADAVLGIAQTYLSQLINLEQWAAEYNLSVDQFNESIRQWEAEFQQAVQQYQDSQDLAIAELTGKFADGTTTLQAQNLVNQQLASSGEALLSYGILPSDEQLEAMGMTREQAQQLVTAAQLRAAADAGTGDGSDTTGPTDFNAMWYEAYQSGSPATWLDQKGNYQRYGLTSKPNMDDYNAWYRANREALANGTYNPNPEPEKDYGTSYSKAVATARLMRAEGKSFAEIDEYLSKFSNAELTDAGLVNIATILNFGGDPLYPFIETERPGVVSG